MSAIDWYRRCGLNLTLSSTIFDEEGLAFFSLFFGGIIESVYDMVYVLKAAEPDSADAAQCAVANRSIDEEQ